MSEAEPTSRAIIFAPLGRDAALAAAILAEAQIAAQTVTSNLALVAALGPEVSFVVLAEEALRDPGASAIRTWLEAQHEWSDLPFILLTFQGGGLERNPHAIRHLDMLGNVTFLERPFHPTTLASVAKAALRARQRQFEARDQTEIIRANDARMRVALVAGKLGAWSLDITTGTLETSADCRAHYGRAPQDSLTSADVVAGIHPDDRPRVRNHMRDVVAGAKDYDVEYRFIWPDGSVRWLQVRGRIDPSAEEHSPTMTGVSRDVTESKTAQARLQRSEERFRAAVNAVQGVVWTNSPEGEMLGEQPGWAMLTGQTREQYQGFGWSAAVHPDDAAPTIEAWRQAVAERRLFEFEHRIRLASGEWRHFSVRAVPALEPDRSVREWVGVHTDITAQRVSEARLAELAASLEQRVEAATADLSRSRARLRSIFESSFQFFGELTPDGVLLEANSTALAAAGVARDQVLNRPFSDSPWFAATPEAPALIRTTVARVAKGEAIRQELVLALPAGQRVLDLSLRPVRDGTGTIVALVLEASDLTERRQAEERLLQSQKLETIGQLTGGVAHDFNNLLTPILSSLEVLGAKLKDDPRAQRWASAGLQSADRARVLVNRLLSFARRQTLETRAVAVPALLDEMAELIRRSIGPAVEVQIQVVGNPPAALADPNQLELSILNLCVNARDAMPGGGRILITVNGVQGQPFDGAPEGEFLQIAVADTGTGMSPETMRKAIEPFFTTKGIGQGTGLGLSMAHGLVGQLGGGMAIASEEGAGTVITLYLPAAGEAAADTAPPIPEAAELPIRDALILLVDDEALLRFATADILTEAGYNVVEAASGLEARALIENGLEIDLLLTDQLMPGMKGSELATELRDRHPKLPVLIASGYSDLPGMPFPLITKPFTSKALIERVRQLVEARSPEQAK